MHKRAGFGGRLLWWVWFFCLIAFRLPLSGPPPSSSIPNCTSNHIVSANRLGNGRSPCSCLYESRLHKVPKSSRGVYLVSSRTFEVSELASKHLVPGLCPRNGLVHSTSLYWSLAPSKRSYVPNPTSASAKWSSSATLASMWSRLSQKGNVHPL